MRRALGRSVAGAARALTMKPYEGVDVKLLPTLDEARETPRHVSELTGDTIFTLSMSGSLDAVRERLRRDIMVRDKIPYEDTTPILRAMNTKNNEGLAVTKVPYQVALWAALVGGFASLPLVFHLPTAEIFNELCVTAEHPQPHELDTMLEVGSWTWGWMEPPLGTISFTLLCIQFAREQRVSLGQKPFTEKLKEQMAERLVAAYPQYSAEAVSAYGQATGLIDDTHGLDMDEVFIAAEVLALAKQGKYNHPTDRDPYRAADEGAPRDTEPRRAEP